MAEFAFAVCLFHLHPIHNDGISRYMFIYERDRAIADKEETSVNANEPVLCASWWELCNLERANSFVINFHSAEFIIYFVGISFFHVSLGFLICNRHIG